MRALRRTSWWLPVLVATSAHACAGPTMPTQPLSTGVVVSVAPPSKAAALVSALPFRWTANWTVNVTVPLRSGRQRFVSAGVRSQIEQNGREVAALPEQVRPFTSVSGEESLLMQVPQSATYHTQATPPTTSQLVIAIRLIASDGRSETLTRTDSIEEALCGLRGQLPCDGASIEITEAGFQPAAVTVAFGQHVTFVNRMPTAHRIRSDPHPTHTGCPPINLDETPPFLVGASAAFFSPGACRYHDDLALGVPGFSGEVTVLPAGTVAARDR